VLDGIDRRHKAFIIDFAAVPLIDSTAANAIGSVVHKAQRRGVAVLISAASPAVQKLLLTHGTRPPSAQFVSSIDEATELARKLTQVPRL
jgi:SulP family sulfate permease